MESLLGWLTVSRPVRTRSQGLLILVGAAATLYSGHVTGSLELTHSSPKGRHCCVHAHTHKEPYVCIDMKVNSPPDGSRMGTYIWGIWLQMLCLCTAKKKKSIFSSIFSIWSESWTLSGSNSKSRTPNYIPNKKHPESIGNVVLSSTTQWDHTGQMLKPWDPLAFLSSFGKSEFLEHLMLPLPLLVKVTVQGWEGDSFNKVLSMQA